MCVPGVEEHSVTVGRAPHQRGLHRDGPDHGLGQQGHRDKECRDWALGWGFYA